MSLGTKKIPFIVYGWAINSSVFDLFLHQFDYSKTCDDLPMDGYSRYQSLRDKIKGINVIPSLIIPKVDHQTEHTMALDQEWFIRNRAFVKNLHQWYSENLWLFKNISILQDNESLKRRISGLFYNNHARCIS